MSDSIIKVTGVSKKYTISHEKSGSYTALRDVIANKFKNTFSRREENRSSTHEDFWALRDLSFEVKQGDAIGIIGRNGAGKSTLLKVLSRITEPTTGRIELNGRVASLLEVGTGFHPELTGRENIFLNGAILGMSRAEIRRKFDEIVQFAEVEKFLDTPVKRYSSGMYVRLAFAVAAHLDPEILIVDEVLAVGDAEFQRKCLGKMDDISKGQGRTVIFVSHNMGAVKQLCNKGLILRSGNLVYSGDINSAIKNYEQQVAQLSANPKWINTSKHNGDAFLESVWLHDRNNLQRTDFVSDEPVNVSFLVHFYEDLQYVKVGYDLLKDGVVIYRAQQTDLDNMRNEFKAGESCTYTCRIPANFLSMGDYEIRPLFSVHNVKPLFSEFISVLKFNVELNKNNYFKMSLDHANFPGVIHPELEWMEVTAIHQPV